MHDTSDLLSRTDLDFLLHDWLRVEDLTDRPRFAEHSRSTFDAIIDVCADLARDRFAPHNRRNDTEEPQLVDGRVRLNPDVRPALDALAETGLLSATADHQLGGLQLPRVVHLASAAWFAAANVSTYGYAMLTVANAHLICAHGSDEQVAKFVLPMFEGRFHGTMCLSEPQAGSSLADTKTRARLAEDGTYRVTGTKLWISGGDHELGENIVHLVLARTGAETSGVRGLSLFIVPKFLVNDDGTIGERNDVTLVGLNHKLGFRGTVNTVLSFGDGTHRPRGSGGAVGYLVGAPGEGLAQMFHMMNAIRLEVGACAAALGYTAYRKSLAYARTRPQGRTPGAKSANLPQVPLVEHADIRRMLLAQKSYAEGALGLTLYCARLLDEQESAPDPHERDRAALLLDVLTPIAKSWPSQWCLRGTSLAIQVHGGYGYTRDYDVEQHYRDSRLNPIHEGTHGIQAIDLLGRKTSMRDGAGLDLLDEKIRRTIAAASSLTTEVADHAADLDRARARLVEVTRVLHAHPEPATRLANASIYLEAAGHIVLGWIWLQQLVALGDRDDDFARGKRSTARYFRFYELPRVAPQLDLLASLDRTTVDLDPAWL